MYIILGTLRATAGDGHILVQLHILGLYQATPYFHRLTSEWGLPGTWEFNILIHSINESYDLQNNIFLLICVKKLLMAYNVVSIKKILYIFKIIKNVCFYYINNGIIFLLKSILSTLKCNNVFLYRNQPFLSMSKY